MNKQTIPQDVRALYNALCERHAAASHAAHDLNDPINSSEDRYRIRKEIEELEFRYPELVSPSSPTQKVGGSAPEDNAVQHATPMLSLEKIHARDGIAPLAAFLAKHNTTMTATPKLDGLAASVVYEDGKLALVATRGDGTTGEDITDNADLIRNLPQETFHDGRLEIRGELIIRRATFEHLNKNREEKFANARNAVAGIMRQKHRTIDEPVVSFLAYSAPTAAKGSYCEDLKWLRNVGFATPCYEKLDPSDADLERIIDSVAHATEEFYEVDGVVFRIDDIATYRAAGHTARAPRGAVAWKFTEQAVRTTIKAVEYQIGRSGVITPVAVLEPVEVSGAVVRKATLHNIAFMKQLGVRKGDEVSLIRSGEVIPKITEVHQDPGADHEDFIIPSTCPDCDTKLIADGRDLRCIGHDCPGIRLEVLKHFCSRPVMNIKGISGKTLEKILRHNPIIVPADLFALTLDDFIAMNAAEGTTNPDGEELDAKAKYRAIEKARSTTLPRVLVSLSIKGLGSSVAKVIAAQPNAEEFIETASAEKLMDLEGVGPETAHNIYDFFHSKEDGYITRDHIRRLKANGVVWGRPEAPITTSQDGPLSGKKVLITGSIPGMTREEAKDWARGLGAEVLSSVSGKLDALIVGNKPGQAKIDKAASLGVGTLHFEDLPPHNWKG